VFEQVNDPRALRDFVYGTLVKDKDVTILGQSMLTGLILYVYIRPSFTSHTNTTSFAVKKDVTSPLDKDSLDVDIRNQLRITLVSGNPDFKQGTIKNKHTDDDDEGEVVENDGTPLNDLSSTAGKVARKTAKTPKRQRTSKK
jgi:hypothetical protein